MVVARQVSASSAARKPGLAVYTQVSVVLMRLAALAVDRQASVDAAQEPEMCCYNWPVVVQVLDAG